MTVAEKIDAAFSNYPKRAYDKGQILLFADENPDHLYYIVSGRVRMYDVSYRGDEVIVNIFKAPAFFPMNWAINRTENHYFYKAEVNTEVHLVPADAAVQFVKDNPDVMLDLLSRLYRGLDGLLGRVVHLMSGTAKSRLAYELVIECRRFGETDTSDSIRLKVNEVELAARSGLSRETISREMQKLKEKGWINLDGRELVVTNFQALVQLLGEPM